jgi:hypothetical protein
LTDDTPYRGLVPYTEEDADWFFGRDEEREVVLANVQSARLTLFYGTSGTGKSSLLRAGVINALAREAEENRQELGTPEFATVYFRDWAGPVEANLVAEIARATSKALGREVTLDPTSLFRACQKATEELAGTLILILDQFEEYFLYHRTFGHFDDELSRIVTAGHLNVNVLISMREDSLSRLDRFKGRASMFQNYLRITHLGRESARLAILEPLDHYRKLYPERAVTMSGDLVEAVLDSVGIGKVHVGEGGRGGVHETTSQVEAPYLQLVVSRLWRDTVERGERQIEANDLLRLGGAEQIVRTHFERVVSRLSQEQQRLAAAVFHYLVTPSGSKISYSVRDLAALTEADPNAIQSLLTVLSAPNCRVLRVAETEATADVTRYEIFHDVLARAILYWRRTYLANLEREERAQEAVAQQRRQIRRILVRAAYAVLLLALSVAGVLAWRYQRVARLEKESAQRVRTLLDEARAAAAKADEQQRQARQAAEEASAKQALLLAEAQRACQATTDSAERRWERLRADLNSAQERAAVADGQAKVALSKATELRVQAAAAAKESISTKY